MSGYPTGTFFHQNPVAFRLTLVCYDGHSGMPATGSIWEHGDKKYLVTNWHVLSGRSTYSGRPLLESMSVPQYLLLHYMKPYPLNHTDHSTQAVRIDLVDENGDPLWLQHEFGQSWDLACIDITENCPVAEAAILPHPLEGNPTFEVPGLDVFIMGFPEGLVKQGGHPIWKRGSIASYSQSTADGELPITLVDTASRPGMSGSPVFFVSYSGEPLFPPAQLMPATSQYKPYQFAGIYSGRYPNEPDAEAEAKAQLGRVWWPHLVEQMLAAPKKGEWEFR